VRTWDYAFGVGSLLPAVLFGVAVGNVLRGVPIAKDATWAGSFLGLLNPYSVVVGLVSLALFTLHGAIYLRMKSEGALADRLGRWIPKLWAAFLALYAIATAWSVFGQPHLFARVSGNPLFWILALLLVVAIAAIPVANAKNRRGLTFVASGTTIVAMIGVAAVSMYPTLVFLNLDPAFALTIYNASSTPRTLMTMLVIALIGMPLVIGYTIFVYRVFKGKAIPTGGYAGSIQA
jgi:cytochrome d ubiquinol oxidase subunit II